MWLPQPGPDLWRDARTGVAATEQGIGCIRYLANLEASGFWDNTIPRQRQPNLVFSVTQGIPSVQREVQENLHHPKRIDDCNDRLLRGGGGDPEVV